jgi:hypothetical protein
MQNKLLLPLASILLASCNDVQRESTPIAAPTVSVSTNGRLTGKLNVSSLTRLGKVELASKLNISLFTLDGALIDKTSALRPNTTYRVVIDGAKDVQVRACFGFDLLDKNEQSNQQESINSFIIKTHSDVLEAPIISIVPLRSVGSKLFREQAQTITLTK